MLKDQFKYTFPKYSRTLWCVFGGDCYFFLSPPPVPYLDELFR